MNFEKCSEKRHDRIISVSEKGRKFEIRNNSLKTICVVEVDGCLIDDGRERCDYLFEMGNPELRAVYVELKGGDIGKAFKQLAATIGYCGNRHLRHVKYCYIVASRVPRSGPKIQTLKKTMAKKYKVQLYVKTQKAVFHV